MKTRSALLLSTTLTSFVLAIVTSVVAGLNSARSSDVAQPATPTQEVVVADIPTQPAPTAVPTPVGPIQAASLAAQFMNKTDVYSVETSSINGVNAFKVVFSSGDVVFIGLDGQVISTTKIQSLTVTAAGAAPPVVAAPAQKSSSGHSSSGGGNHGDDGGGDG